MIDSLSSGTAMLFTVSNTLFFATIIATSAVLARSMLRQLRGGKTLDETVALLKGAGAFIAAGLTSSEIINGWGLVQAIDEVSSPGLTTGTLPLELFVDLPATFLGVLLLAVGVVLDRSRDMTRELEGLV